MRISFIPYLLFVFLFSGFINAQNFSFNWAKQMGGSFYTRGISITSDSDGNIFSAGLFQGTVDFDPGSGVHNLTSQFGWDIYIQKLDSIGNLLWVKQISCDTELFIATINTDTIGNIFLTGSFRGTVDLDPSANTLAYTSTGLRDTFIQKLDSLGNLIWGKRIEGGQQTIAYSSILDLSGNIYTIGSFQGTVDFDPNTGTYDLVSPGDRSAFIQKLDSLGNLKWAKRIGGNGAVVGKSIAIDSNNNVFSVGEFYGTADFDPNAGVQQLTSTNYSIGGGFDAFIHKIDSLGNFLWVRQIGNAENEEISALTIDPSGNIYIAGNFVSIVDFDPGVGVSNLTSSVYGDQFVLKMSNQGSFIWTRQFLGLSGESNCTSMKTDINGNLYSTGFFDGEVDFAPAMTGFNLISNGIRDIYINGLDTNGNLLFIKKVGGSSSDFGRSLTIDLNDNIYCTGQFSGLVDFNSGSGVNILQNTGNDDAYVLKLSPCSLKMGTDSRVECSPFEWIDGNIYTSDNNSATYTIFGGSSSGCDSTITLDLTIYGQATTKTDTVVACKSYTWIDGVTYFLSNDTATYTFSGASTNGCDSIVTLNLTIQSVSDRSTTITGQTIMANNSNASYQWLDCLNNNAPIMGEISQTYTATLNGEYAVELIENGCVDTSECVLINSVSVNELTKFEGFKIYPNPSNGVFNISLSSVVSELEVSIEDLQGRLINVSRHNNVDKIQMELPNLSGVYFVTIKTSDFFTIVSLIRE